MCMCRRPTAGIDADALHRAGTALRLLLDTLKLQLPAQPHQDHCQPNTANVDVVKTFERAAHAINGLPQAQIANPRSGLVRRLDLYREDIPFPSSASTRLLPL